MVSTGYLIPITLRRLIPPHRHFAGEEVLHQTGFLHLQRIALHRAGQARGISAGFDTGRYPRKAGRASRWQHQGRSESADCHPFRPASACCAKIDRARLPDASRRRNERMDRVAYAGLNAHIREPLIYSVRPELVEGQMAHRQGLRQAQPERVGVFQSFLMGNAVC
jgi:hypothetical protein